MSEIYFETTTFHIVKPEDLNHHNSLFAGQTAKWMIEAALLTASRLTGRPEDVVCVKVNNFVFTKSLYNGDLIEIRSKIAHLGTSSITIHNELIENKSRKVIVSNMATFVTVDKDNKPYAHGFKLSEEYIRNNKDIVEAALKMRESK